MDARHDMTREVEGDLDAGVTEALLDHPRVYSHLEKQRGGGMAQVMEAGRCSQLTPHLLPDPLTIGTF